MSDKIFVKTYSAPPIDEREILRYAGCKEGDGGVLSLLKQTLLETENSFSYRVCYRELSLAEFYERCPQAETSADLKKLFLGCESVVLFCATVGIAIDRKILEYGVRSPAQAVLAQAIGTERIESLCDTFCQDLQKQYLKKGLTSRYSAGYGDFSLSAQKEIFALLNCSKHIGLTLTESLLMSPTKSVSAIIGIKEEKTEENSACKKRCASCDKKDCAFKING